MRIPFKKTAVLSLAATVCFTLLRILQIFFCCDPETGFFYVGYEKTGTEFSIVIFAFLIICFFLSFLEQKTAAEYPKTGLLMAIGYFLVGALVIFDLIFFPTDFSLGIPQRFLYSLFGIITAAVALLEAINFFYPLEFLSFIRNENGNIFPIFSVCALIFWILRTVFFFAFYTEMAVISDHVFDIIALLCVLVLLLYIAYLSNNVQSVKAKRRLLPLIVLSFLTCICSSLPHFLLFIFGQKDKLHAFNSNHITVLGIAVFLGIFYFASFSEENLREKVKKHKKDLSRFIR